MVRVYALIIDGETIEEADFVKPLIERLDQYARDTGFEEATIKVARS